MPALTKSARNTIVEAMCKPHIDTVMKCERTFMEAYRKFDAAELTAEFGEQVGAAYLKKPDLFVTRSKYSDNVFTAGIYQVHDKETPEAKETKKASKETRIARQQLEAARHSFRCTLNAYKTTEKLLKDYPELESILNKNGIEYGKAGSALAVVRQEYFARCIEKATEPAGCRVQAGFHTGHIMNRFFAPSFRLLFSLAVALAVALVITGCGSGGESEPEPVSLSARSITPQTFDPSAISPDQQPEGSTRCVQGFPITITARSDTAPPQTATGTAYACKD